MVVPVVQGLPGRRRIWVVVRVVLVVLGGITATAVLGVPAGRGLPALPGRMRARRVVMAATVLLGVRGVMGVPGVPGGWMPATVVMGVPAVMGVLAAPVVTGALGLLVAMPKGVVALVVWVVMPAMVALAVLVVMVGLEERRWLLVSRMAVPVWGVPEVMAALEGSVVLGGPVHTGF